MDAWHKQLCKQNEEYHLKEKRQQRRQQRRHMMEEPEIIFSGEGEGPTLSPSPDLDLDQYTEEEFRLHYKSTKSQYLCLRDSIKQLTKTYRELEQPGPLEMDPDVLNNIEYLIQDFTDLLEQMHLAAEWEKDKH